MWDLRIARPFEGYSIRKVLTIAAMLLAACFLYIFATTPTTSAQTTETDTKAQWSGLGLTYQGQEYRLLDKNDRAYNSSLPGTLQYLYVETPLSNPGTGLLTAHVIYFTGNSPPQNVESKASYVEYVYAVPNKYTEPTAARQITIAPETADAKESTTSCDINGGLGWIICPVATTLAGAMNTLFSVLASFLVVQPIQTTSNNSIYRGWEIMRNFANVAFVIGFLIIIYSQISSIGISNYGIKKLLPRLIIAAVLVNISYWICAIAVDASNIVGYSIHDLFNSIANGLVAEGDVHQQVDMSKVWTEVVALSLSGATAGTIGTLALLANPGSIFMILPILLGALLAILVALLILAARQAIITIAIIISPLAFVAYLLPNTEKYFEKWRELLTTMLLMFPIISAIFGGAHLAAMVIINNANDLMGYAFGLGVEVAPFLITPLIVRFSGGLLGRIAGMVNNPNKGLIDRTRNFAKERGDQLNSSIQGNYKNRYGGAFGRASRRVVQGRQLREEQKKANDEAAHNLLHENPKYKRIYEQNKMNEDTKKILEGHHEQEWNDKVRATPGLLERKLQVSYTVDAAKASEEKLETLAKEARTAKLDDLGNVIVPVTFEHMARQSGNAGFTSGSMAQMINNSRDVALDLTREALRKQNAERALASMHNVDLKNNTNNQALMERVGSVRGEQGANSAVAYAISEERKAFGVGAAEAGQLWRHFNPDSKELQKFINGEELTLTDDTGVTRTFKADDVYARDAAIEMQITEGPVKYAIETASMSGSDLRDHRTTIASAWAKGGLSKKTSFGGGTAMDQIKAGYITSPDQFLYGVVQDAIAKGKIAPEVLVDIDVDAIESYVNAALAAKSGNVGYMDPELRTHIEPQIQAFANHAQTALTNPLYKGRVKDNVKRELLRLLDDVPAETPPEEPPTPGITAP
jgi:hypothetical protein